MNPDDRPILACTDFSDPAGTTVRTAADLGVKLGAPVMLVYVVEDRIPPMIVAASSDSAEEIVARHVETARKHIVEWVERHVPGHDLEMRVATGVPHEAIVEIAREVHASMVVIGQRGHGLLGRRLLGSTTARVVTDAPCAVLVVRREE